MNVSSMRRSTSRTDFCETCIAQTNNCESKPCDATSFDRRREKRFVYAHRAVEAIAATGAVGTAYLREQSATPPFANYLWSVVDEQRKQHDRAAVP